MNAGHALLAPIRELQEEVRRAVVDACERASLEELSGIAADGEGDTIYAIDRVSEGTLVEFFAREVALWASLVLVAEGVGGGRVVLPSGTREEDARWRVIVDPIDGTRGLMYQKRSGWVLTGVAPNLRPSGAQTIAHGFAMVAVLPGCPRGAGCHRRGDRLRRARVARARKERTSSKTSTSPRAVSCTS